MTSLSRVAGSGAHTDHVAHCLFFPRLHQPGDDFRIPAIITELPSGFQTRGDAIKAVQGIFAIGLTDSIK